MDSNKLRLFIGLIQSSLEVSEVSEFEQPALRSLLILRLLRPVVFLWSKFAYKVTYVLQIRSAGLPVARYSYLARLSIKWRKSDIISVIKRRFQDKLLVRPIV